MSQWFWLWSPAAFRFFLLSYWDQARNSSYKSTAMFYSLIRMAVRLPNKITHVWRMLVLKSDDTTIPPLRISNFSDQRKILLLRINQVVSFVFFSWELVELHLKIIKIVTEYTEVLHRFQLFSWRKQQNLKHILQDLFSRSIKVEWGLQLQVTQVLITNLKRHHY